MTITLENIGKRFLYDWIFRNVTCTLDNGAFAILGHNGSGKSTLMKVISGHLTPSTGKISFINDNQKISEDNIYKLISYAAPYIELVEEFTLDEQLQFHQNFKPFFPNLTIEGIKDILKLSNTQDKQIKFYSSGMKQRLKLVLACCSETPVLLLDEPTTNLDKQGVSWYQQLVSQFTNDRLVLIASNVEDDYFLCKQQIVMTDFKKK